jgi:cytochrome c5
MGLLIVLGVVLAIGLIGMTRGATAGPVDQPVAMAADDDADNAPEKLDIKPSDKKGKYWFKKSCKSCHGKDSDSGEVTPLIKTQKQWERYFRKDVHHGEEKLQGTFEAEQLIHIQFFLINHAADSDQPETCG